MYESTLNVEKKNNHLLTYVKSQLEPYLNEIDGISTELEDDSRNYYSLACSDTYRFQIRRCISSAVTQALSLGYKNVYFRDLLNIKGASFYQNVLVNTICILDNEYDKQFISRVIEPDNTICLDGYYNFRMSVIKRKWLEISKLVSDNDFILTDNDLIVEFLQYLSESMTCKEERLSVSLDKDGFILFGGENKTIAALQSLAQPLNVEEETALNVICLKPKKVVFYYDDEPSEDFCDLMDSLFATEYVRAL